MSNAKKQETKKQQKRAKQSTTSPHTNNSTFALYQHLGILPELAMEAHDLLRGEHGGEIPGVELVEEHAGNWANLHIVRILNEQGSRIMQKPIGTYITLFSQEFATNHRRVQQELTTQLIHQLQILIHLPVLSDPVLVVGLGNWSSTPDSLGPRFIHQMTATRHLYGNVPDSYLEGVRPVVTIAPGVLGMTGMESAEIVRGVVERLHPKLILVVDALAAGDASRIGTTIQISSTGITPGSGIGNTRTGIQFSTMGVPVVSIGIPTVVKARIIAHQVLETFLHRLQKSSSCSKALHVCPQEELSKQFEKALSSCPSNLDVTPKEIDDLVQNCSTLLANAVTQVLHPNRNAAFADNFF